MCWQTLSTYAWNSKLMINPWLIFDDSPVRVHGNSYTTTGENVLNEREVAFYRDKHARVQSAFNWIQWRNKNDWFTFKICVLRVVIQMHSTTTSHMWYLLANNNELQWIKFHLRLTMTGTVSLFLPRLTTYTLYEYNYGNSWYVFLRFLRIFYMP